MTATDSRTERLERLIGSQGMDALSSAHVMVIGIGGVGSNCVEALARGGIGTITIVDPDDVQTSNINRQAIAFDCTVGKRKVDVMRAMILQINPSATVKAIAEKVLPDNVERIFETAHPDFCIDAQDTVVTKLALAAFCERNSIPLLSSMGAANTYDPTKLAFADIYETSVCPLCRIVRKKARQEGIGSMRVLYSQEQPERTEPKEGSRRWERTDLGTMSYMPAIMGQMLAARCICDILSIEW